MVDEFQDTNALQLELLELLARENACTVGDELQAIYAFRHADVEVFRARRARLEAAGRTATLATNFRSRPEILRALNDGFGPLHERWVDLRPGRGAQQHDDVARSHALLVHQGPHALCHEPCLRLLDRAGGGQSHAERPRRVAAACRVTRGDRCSPW